MSTLQPDDLAIIDTLARGPVHRFADWPNPSVPMSAIGLYAVWRDQQVRLRRHGGQSERGRPPR